MTRKELDTLLANAILQRDRAQKMILEHFNELEARNQETFWVRLYLLKKAEVIWLEKQKADSGSEPDE
ncbi:hypothetical protein [Spirosoma luteum]|uniref:hypothetical protein n=1 Tax=Spirosoma luteum TaxID=431553 RepID=UPI0003A986EE|nr:hypothetical protein [Spirosoma luteum]